MAGSPFPIVDCDGHLMESLEELAKYAEPSIAQVCLQPRVFFRGPFPTLDGLHFLNPTTARMISGPKRVYASEHRPGSAEDWAVLLDRTGMDHTVLYTSDGLTIGLVRMTDY